VAHVRKMQVVYICNFVSSIDRQIHFVYSLVHYFMAGQLFFDVWGYSWVWVGLDIGSISSPGSGLGWGQLFGSLGWVGSMKIGQRATLDSTG